MNTDRLAQAAARFMDQLEAEHGADAVLTCIGIVADVEEGEGIDAVTGISTYCDDERRFVQLGLWTAAASTARNGETFDPTEDDE